MSKQEQSRRMRARLVAAAKEAIVMHGYQGTNLKLVAELAGVSRGPLHYHFADKYELFAEVARDVPQAIGPDVRARLDKACSLREKLLTVVGVALEQYSGDHHIIIIELLIASRTDEQLSRKVMAPLLEAEGKVDDRWVNYMRDLSGDDHILLALRQLIVAVARGFAMDRLENADAVNRDEAAVIFREMVSLWIDRELEKLNVC